MKPTSSGQGSQSRGRGASGQSGKQSVKPTSSSKQGEKPTSSSKQGKKPTLSSSQSRVRGGGGSSEKQGENPTSSSKQSEKQGELPKFDHRLMETGITVEMHLARIAQQKVLADSHEVEEIVSTQSKECSVFLIREDDPDLIDAAELVEAILDGNDDADQNSSSVLNQVGLTLKSNTNEAEFAEADLEDPEVQDALKEAATDVNTQNNVFENSSSRLERFTRAVSRSTGSYCH